MGSHYTPRGKHKPHLKTSDVSMYLFILALTCNWQHFVSYETERVRKLLDVQSLQSMLPLVDDILFCQLYLYIGTFPLTGMISRAQKGRNLI